MRVIAGEAKGHPLKAPKVSTTRPTSDKVKGAIFSMIESALMVRHLEREGLWHRLKVLDLFAGSGALGIEALSRGADWADFVDDAAAACRTVHENLAHTKLASKSKIHCSPVLRTLSSGYRGRLAAPYDIVFLDPPYADPTISQVMETIGQTELVRSEGMVVIEHSRRVSLLDRYGVLRLLKSRRHGDTLISIYVSEDTSRSSENLDNDIVRLSEKGG